MIKFFIMYWKCQLIVRYLTCAVVLLAHGPLSSDGKRLSKIFPPEIITRESFPCETHSITTEDGYILSVHRIPGPSGSTLPELIAQENYPAETHKITTEDGYILTAYRIPGPPDAEAVLLQHGFLECSANWLITGRGKSLAYILSDLGYDVWLGNARGSTYSKSHVNLTTLNPKFWDFGWDELAMYDLPAVITYITDLKEDKMFYIGHSLGGSSFVAMASERPEIAERVKLMIGLAPAVYLQSMRSPMRMFAPFLKQIEIMAELLGIYEFLPRNALFDAFAKYICQTLMVSSALCSTSLSLIGGPDLGEVDPSVLSQIYSTFPAGSSIKLGIQLGQQVIANTFSKFDHGKQGNLKIYNSTTPLGYDLSKVHVPVALFYAPNDWLTDPKDVKRLYEELPLKSGIYGVNSSKFNHLDFLWGRDAPKLVYAKVTEIMAKFS